jgi:cell division protein FtsN
VSHRIRRQPSIFSAGWFRLCLGAGVIVVLALLVGPWVAGWFGGDLPRSLFLLAPWRSESRTSQTRSSPPVGEKSGLAVKPTAPPASPVPTAPRGTAAATDKPPMTPAEGQPASGSRVVAGGPLTATPKPPATPAESQAPSGGRVAAGGPSTAAAAKPAAPTAASAPTPREASRSSTPAEAATARSGSLAAPPAVYWVQVGAFLDHRNADKLAERLRGEGLPAATTAFEQSRVLYRVLLAGPDGGAVPSEVVERARGLGHPVGTTPDGPAVTGAVPLRKAVETSHSLRQQGIQVRLKQEVSSSTYRVVRVGSFATVAEAEGALATLTSKGVEGIVVRER